MKSKQSKTQRLVKHLISGKTINGHQALTRFGIYRLSSVIFNLKKKGFVINTTMVQNKNNRYAMYTLVDTPSN
tara:strand:+ start:4069 stop:4287 length:219 start_codon:yes stop_codon:yes gene_type:complete